MKRRAAVTIGPREAGRTLLDFLSGRFTYLPRHGWEDMLERGRVLLNAGLADGTLVLRADDRVEYLQPETPEPEVERDVSILYEDEAILVANKPANLPCHPGGKYFQNTLWAFLRTRMDREKIRLVHRLDRESSGIILVAKTARAAAACQRQFASGVVEKRYEVLVEGLFPEDRVEAEGYLVPDRDSVIRKKRKFRMAIPVAPPPPGGVFSLTVFRRTGFKNGVSRLEAFPATGRPHQIRATLLALGYPVVGDKLYGLDESIFLRFIRDDMTSADRRRLRLSRQALHSAELRLRHPETGLPCTFTAPLPPDMEVLLKASGASSGEKVPAPG